jgi:hypothetical protein
MAEEASRAGEFLIIPVLGAKPCHFDVVSLLREAALAGAFIAADLFAEFPSCVSHQE